jgi:hypothetical protein
MTVLRDIPDIVIESKKWIKIIIDAKNRRYLLGTPRPNLHQMRSYMRALGAKCGLFIHSESENPNLWKEIINETDNQNIIWTSITPDPGVVSSVENFERTVRLINDYFL